LFIYDVTSGKEIVRLREVSVIWDVRLKHFLIRCQ